MGALGLHPGTMRQVNVFVDIARGSGKMGDFTEKNMTSMFKVLSLFLSTLLFNFSP